MIKRELLPYGFSFWLSGVVWTNSQVDQYNRLQERINKYIEEGYEIPERLLNSSHKLFSMFCELI